MSTKDTVSTNHSFVLTAIRPNSASPSTCSRDRFDR
jgi:hypothetical protein